MAAAACLSGQSGVGGTGSNGGMLSGVTGSFLNFNVTGGAVEQMIAVELDIMAAEALPGAFRELCVCYFFFSRIGAGTQKH